MNTAKAPKSSIMKRNVQKFMNNRLAISGLTIVLTLMVLVVFAPLFTEYDPTAINNAGRLLPPSGEHWLGTDRLGRDLVARLLYGGRVSIFVGLTSALSAGALGIILGCLAGYFGGKVDYAIVYVAEIFQSFPQTLLVMIVIGFAGRGLANMIVIFAVTGWAQCMRIVRSRVLSLKEEPFVESLRSTGVGGLSIMFRHLLPNTMGPLTVHITLSSAGYMLAEAGLSFLGLGVPTEIPTWGNIINAARSLDMIQNHPALWIAPGVAISLFVLGINFFGDGMRDVLDPTQ